MIELIRQALHKRRMKRLQRQRDEHRAEAERCARLAELHGAAAELTEAELIGLEVEQDLRDSGLPTVIEVDASEYTEARIAQAWEQRA